jgi:hypothetical protein
MTFLFAAVVLAAFFPDTPAGALLRRYLIEEPIQAFRSLSLSGFIFIVVFCLAVCAFGQAFAAELAWIMAIDFATFAEILAAVALTIAATRYRTVYGHAAAMARRATRRAALTIAIGVRRFTGAPRAIRLRRTKQPKQDDADGAWGFTFA